MKNMKKWIIFGAIGLTFLLMVGVVAWQTHRATLSSPAPSSRVMQGETTADQSDVDAGMSQNAEGESIVGVTQLHMGSTIETRSATVYVSSTKQNEDKLWGKQEGITLGLVGKGATPQPLSRVLQFYLEDRSGRWTPVSGREARWQEAILLPGQPLRITLSFRGLGEGMQGTLALETDEGKTLVSLLGEDRAPALPSFRCENPFGMQLPLQVEIRRTWHLNASPMAQPLPDHQFLALEMMVHPVDGYAPQLQMWNVLLVDHEGNQYPATPYALPVDQQLSVGGVVSSDRRALVGFEVPLNANPHCLVIVTAERPIYVPLPGA